MGLPGYLDRQIKHESSDEFVIYRASRSWIPVIIRIVPVVALFCIVGGVVWHNFGLVPGILVLLAGILLSVLMQASKIIYNLGVDIVVTNKYLRCKKNLISVTDDRSSSLSRIDDIDVDFPTVFNRIFGYGNIEIQTINGTDDFFKFNSISKPEALRSAINNAKDTYASWGDSNYTGLGSSSKNRRNDNHGQFDSEVPTRERR